jgi:hypothetical protein
MHGAPSKVLLIGNSVFDRNSLEKMIEYIAVDNQYSLSITKFTIDGATISESLGRFINQTRSKNKKNRLTQSFWKSGDNDYKYFTKQIRSFDYIFLQATSLKEDKFVDIVNSIVKVKKKDTKIFIYQNYCTVLWDDSIRSNEININKQFFENCFSKTANLLPVGDWFNNIYSSKNIKNKTLLINDMHPSTLGSAVIAIGIYYYITNQIPLFDKGLLQKQIGDANVADLKIIMNEILYEKR